MLCLVGNGPRKNSPKIPAIFQCRIPRVNSKKKSTIFLLESGQSNEYSLRIDSRFEKTVVLRIDLPENG